MIQNHLIAWAVCWLVESTGKLWVRLGWSGSGSGIGSGWWMNAVVSDICRHILPQQCASCHIVTYVAVTCKIVIIPVVAATRRTNTSVLHCNKLNCNFKGGSPSPFHSCGVWLISLEKGGVWGSSDCAFSTSLGLLFVPF